MKRNNLNSPLRSAVSHRPHSSCFSNYCSLPFFSFLASYRDVLPFSYIRFSLLRSLTSLKRFSLLRSLTSLKRFSLLRSLTSLKRFSLLFTTSLSLHILFRTFVYLHHDAPASHSFSMLRVLLSSTCSCPSARPTTKDTTQNLYARVYKKNREILPPC